MTRLRHLRDFSIVIVVIFSFSLGYGRSTWAQNWWIPPSDIDRLQFPTLLDLQRAYSQLAWLSFISLNWPAVYQNGYPYPSPDTSKNLSYNGGNYITVWEAWMEVTEIFKTDGSVPLAWGSPHKPPRDCISLGSEPSQLILSASSKGGDVESEFVQAFRMGPLPDQNQVYTWFGINTNEAMYNYIVDNKLYNTEGQVKFNQSADWPRGKPNSSGSVEDVGSIFVKSAWKVIGANDDQNRFHITNAWLYNPGDKDANIPESCTQKTVGLVGFHIVRRLYSAPQWVWATFEHDDNAPQQSEVDAGNLPKKHYSYFDADCVRNACNYNILPAHPWNPDANNRTPTQVVRTGVLGLWAAAMNKTFQTGNPDTTPVADTVWANYNLVDIQFPTLLSDPSPQGIYSINKAYPNGEPTPRFLANTTLETYIQGFTAEEITSNGNQIPDNDQAGGHGGAPRMTSSCIGCHGDATQTSGFNANYVYMLNRARPVAGTLRSGH